MWTAWGILLLSACRMTAGRTDWKNHHCPAPRSPINGLSFIFRDGEVVQYTCHPGYRMIGRYYAYCVDNRWNSPPPRCVPSHGYEEFRAATAYTVRPGMKDYHLRDKTSTERPLFHWEDKQPPYPLYGDRENRLPLINGIWKPSQKPENILSIGTTTRIDNDVEDLIEKEKKIAELRQRQLEEVKNKRYGYITFPHGSTHRPRSGQYHGSINVVVLPPAPEELNKPTLTEKQKKRKNKKNKKRNRKKHIQELRHKPETKVNVQTDLIRDSIVERKSRPYIPSSNLPNENQRYKPYDPRTFAYDSSCYESSHGRTYPLKAPQLPKTIVWRYETHKHSEKSATHYMTVRYKCFHGYRFQDVRINKLYCQEGRWVGETPICVQ